jgi:hypothetical protein
MLHWSENLKPLTLGRRAQPLVESHKHVTRGRPRPFHRGAELLGVGRAQRVQAEKA